MTYRECILQALQELNAPQFLVEQVRSTMQQHMVDADAIIDPRMERRLIELHKRSIIYRIKAQGLDRPEHSNN
jgi:hypothetical protein